MYGSELAEWVSLTTGCYGGGGGDGEGGGVGGGGGGGGGGVS